MIFSVVKPRFLSVTFKVLATLFSLVCIVSCGSGTQNSADYVPSLTLTLVNADGIRVNSTSIGTSYQLRASVVDSYGPAANVIVTFQSGGLANLVPNSGTALTNSSGIAEIEFIPTTSGAAMASAIASVTQVIKSTSSTSTTTTSLVTVQNSFNYSVAVTR